MIKTPRNSRCSATRACRVFRHPRGHFDTGGRIPQTADSRVQFVVGTFQDTLPEFIAQFRPRNRIAVNIDCDLYSSALYCLTKLDPIAGEIIASAPGRRRE
jgi:hypothetical protein